MQRVSHFLGAGIAVERVFCQRLEDDVAELFVDGYFAARGELDRFGSDAVHDLVNVAALHCLVPNHHFVKDQAGGENIVFFADCPAVDVFRRHIGWRANQDIVVLARFVGDAFGDAEIHDPRDAFRADQDVGGFEVPMDDAVLVGVGDGLEHRADNADGLVGGQSPLFPQQIGQGLPLDILEHQIGIAIVFPGLENRHEVGVTQLADGARFLDQRLNLALLVLVFCEMQGFYRHFALQLGIVSKINHTLRTLAQNPGHFKSVYFLYGLIHAVFREALAVWLRGKKYGGIVIQRYFAIDMADCRLEAPTFGNSQSRPAGRNRSKITFYA